MSEPINWTERRQFGRRPLNADAIAQLPGAVEIPCVIENLSEGGALLFFPTGVAPISDFHLAVEDVPFRLACEMRYQIGIRFGVRFRRVDHGEALVRHFFGSTAAAASASPRKLPDRAPLPASSIRQLRETLLPLIAPDAVRADAAPGADGSVAPARAGAETPLTPPSNSPNPRVYSRPARLTARR